MDAEDVNHDDQSWFWTDEWQEGERRVDIYIRQGDVQEFDTMEEFIQTLKDLDA